MAPVRIAGDGQLVAAPTNMVAIRGLYVAAVREQAKLCEAELLRASRASNVLWSRIHRESAQCYAERAWMHVRNFTAIEARASGQGFAGTCPGDGSPKTPATQELVSHVRVAANTDVGDTSASATAHGREGIA